MRSTLAPYYVRLERMLAGMLTRKPVRLEDVSDVVTEQLFDVDLQGNDLETFGPTKPPASASVMATSAFLLMRQKQVKTAGRIGPITRRATFWAGALKSKTASRS